MSLQARCLRTVDHRIVELLCGIDHERSRDITTEGQLLRDGGLVEKIECARESPIVAVSNNLRATHVGREWSPAMLFDEQSNRGDEI